MERHKSGKNCNGCNGNGRRQKSPGKSISKFISIENVIFFPFFYFINTNKMRHNKRNITHIYTLHNSGIVNFFQLQLNIIKCLMGHLIFNRLIQLHVYRWMLVYYTLCISIHIHNHLYVIETNVRQNLNVERSNVHTVIGILYALSIEEQYTIKSLKFMVCIICLH